MAAGSATWTRRRTARRAAATAAALLAGATLLLLLLVRPGWDGGPTFTLRVDPGRLLARLRAARSWLGPFVAAAALLPALRALVWREVLPAPAPRLAATYHATALGALVHNAVPGKLGPLAAAWVLARTESRSVAPALSSQLVAKLLELGGIVLLGATAVALRPSPAPLRVVVASGAVLFAVLAAAAVGVALGAPGLSARLGRRLPRAGALLAALGEGLAGAGRPARVAAALALALLPAATAAIAYGFPLQAAGVAGSAAGGALVVAVITFGQLTPGLPVGAGIYWTLAAWAARQLGAGEEDAVALAVVTHAAMVVTSLAVGGTSALLRRRDVPALLRRRREVAHGAARESDGQAGPAEGPGLPRRQGV